MSRFTFLKPGPMLDGELELIEPAYRWVDAYVHSTQHLGNYNDATCQTTRQQLLDDLVHEPHGQRTGNLEIAPSYGFWMHLRPQDSASHSTSPVVTIAGGIRLRVGDVHDVVQYYGHVGYNVFPVARGNHLAERACRLLMPLARQHGMTHWWITCNPDNKPSRRTCERLGAEMVEIVDLPMNNPMYIRGERQKCRYLLMLDKVS